VGPARDDRIESAVSRGDIDYLVKALDDPSTRVRLDSVREIGEIGSSRAKETLLTLLRDRWGRRPDVRLEAIRALEDFYSPRDYSRLLGQYICEDNRKLVSGARKILSELDPDGYPSTLLESGCLDRGAISTYGRAGLEPAAGLLGEFLQSLLDTGEVLSTGQWGKAYSAVRALGNIAGGESVNILEDFERRLQSFGAEGPLREARRNKIMEAARASISALGRYS
jgi:hypothetical protein